MQGLRSRPQKYSRPRTALPRTNSLEAKDRNAEDRRPRTQRGSNLQKKKVLAPIICKFFGKFRRSQKKKSSLQNFVNFKRSPGKQMSSENCSQLLRRSTRNKIGHDLGRFSTSHKILLSSRRG